MTFLHYPDVLKCLEKNQHPDAQRLKGLLESTNSAIREIVLKTHLRPRPAYGMPTVCGQITFAITREPDFTAILSFVEQEIARHESQITSDPTLPAISAVPTWRRIRFALPHRNRDKADTQV